MPSMRCRAACASAWVWRGALAVAPKFMLMDEPLGALDELNRERMQTLILTLWQQSGKGIFLITHSIEEALFLATELVLMSPRPGRIVKRFSPPFARRFIAGEYRCARSRRHPSSSPMREELVEAVMAGEQVEATGGN